MRTRCALLLSVATLTLAPAGAAEPPFERHARVGFDRNLMLPGHVPRRHLPGPG